MAWEVVYWRRRRCRRCARFLRTRPASQHYEATMTVRVDGLDELSPSTQQAMRITRALGGYVVSAKFNAAKQGASALVFRIPIGHVQQAITKFSAPRDDRGAEHPDHRSSGAVQPGSSSRSARRAWRSPRSTTGSRARRSRTRSASASSSVGPGLPHRLEALRTSGAHDRARAALATVSLGLTTKEAAAVAKPEHRGPLGRALHDAGNILEKEASWALYALIVLGADRANRARRVPLDPGRRRTFGSPPA